MTDLIKLLQQKTQLNPTAITNTLKLLDEGATSDDVLRDFYEVYMSAKRLLDRKEEILKLLIEREVITPQLKSSIESALTMTALEDIYRPYKEKKNSRASLAMKNDLEPLANILQFVKLSKQEFEAKAKQFVRASVKSVDEAVKGAKDIVAEHYLDAPKERNIIRDMFLKHGVLEVKKGKVFEAEGLYKNDKEHSEKIAFISSHRYLVTQEKSYQPFPLKMI